jgi:Tfp pilus assembly protein PilF
VVSSACVANGRLVVGGLDGFLYCIDAAKGLQVWKFKARGKISSSPSLSGGAIYFGSDDGSVYCVGPARAVEKKERTPLSMDQEQFDGALARAVALIDEGRYHDAVIVCRGLVEAREDSAAARTQLGRSLEGTGEIGLAENEYKLAVQLKPLDAVCRNDFGKYLARLGRIREAMSEFDSAREIAPAAPEAYLNSAKLYLTEGKTGDAEKQFRMALERSKDDPEALLWLAEIFTGKREFEQARPLLERCLQVSPGNARAREQLDQMKRNR